MFTPARILSIATEPRKISAKVDALVSASVIFDRRARAGMRYYINPESPDIQYFALLRLGTYAVLSGIGENGAGKDLREWVLFPEFHSGMGFDWNWTPHLGLTTGLYLGYPWFVSPEVALKYRF